MPIKISQVQVDINLHICPVQQLKIFGIVQDKKVNTSQQFTNWN